MFLLLFANYLELAVLTNSRNFSLYQQIFE